MKVLGRVLYGLGVFMLVLAPLLRFYAYPHLAVVPLDQASDTVSTGQNVTVFYLDGLTVKNGVDLTYTRRTIGQVAESKKAGDNIAVWDSFSAGADADGAVLASSLDRVAFDRTTAEGVDCCNQYTASSDRPEDRKPIVHTGLFFKFPFNAQKKTYQFWDDTLLKPTPAEYVRTEKLDGVSTYVYRQTIAPVTTETQDVPAALVGESGNADVSVDRVYQNVRTLWVEPETGAIIKGQEEQNVRFEKDGQEVLPLLKGTIAYNAKTIKEGADEYGPLGTQLKLIRITLPIGLLVVGLILLVVGLVIRFGPGSSKRSVPEPAEPPAPAEQPVS